MDPALAWAILGLVLVITELVTGTFYLVMLALAAFGAAAAAYFEQGFPLQSVVAAGVAAAGVRAVAEAIGDKGGLEAANLKVAQQYIDAFANLAKTSNTLIIPTSASDVAGFIATAMTVLDKTRHAQAAAKA